MANLLDDVEIIWWIERREGNEHYVELTDAYFRGDTQPDLDAVDAEVAKQKPLLIEWLRKHPMPRRFRYIEGNFDNNYNGFDGYGNTRAKDGGPLYDKDGNEVHEQVWWTDTTGYNLDE